MAKSSATAVENVRISPDGVKERLEGGEALTVLDVRAEKSWESSDQRIRGDIRVAPESFRVDPSWPKDRLTVAYCT